jgi:RNA polymerase sigma-70 factor (ECF subfamily)
MSNKHFPKTSWSLIVRAGAMLTSDNREALKVLCEAYWFPVYAFIRRRAGSADKALDRTQGFFAYLLEKNAIATVDPTRGSKFRSWLLACVEHYLKTEYKKEHARKRDCGHPIESLDAAAAEGRYQAEASHHLTPESLYARHFALSLLERVIERLRAKYAAAGKEALFEALKGSLSQDAGQRPYDETAALLGMTGGAVKKAAFDLRARYKKELWAEVASLVDGGTGPAGGADSAPDAQVTDEIRQLLAALAE